MPLARCTVPACPVRFTTPGPDRICQWHADDDQASYISRASGFAVTITMPGDDDSDGQAAR